MSERRKVAKRAQPRASGTLPSADLAVGTVREVEVAYIDEPAPVPKEQEIHPRRAIPGLPVEPESPPPPKRGEG